MRKISLILATCYALTSLSALATDNTTAVPNLADQVKAAVLAAYPTLAKYDLTFTAEKDIVTIEGQVDTGEQLGEIGLAAQEVKGVKFIMNNVTPKE